MPPEAADEFDLALSSTWLDDLRMVASEEDRPAAPRPRTNWGHVQ